MNIYILTLMGLLIAGSSMANRLTEPSFETGKNTTDYFFSNNAGNIPLSVTDINKWVTREGNVASTVLQTVDIGPGNASGFTSVTGQTGTKSALFIENSKRGLVQPVEANVLAGNKITFSVDIAVVGGTADGYVEVIGFSDFTGLTVDIGGLHKFTGGTYDSLIADTLSNAAYGGTNFVTYSNSVVAAADYTYLAVLIGGTGGADGSTTKFFAFDNVLLTGGTHLLIYAAGDNGTISGDTNQTVAAEGDGTPVTAMADSGYAFWDWSDGSTDNPRTDSNVTANITVTANFMSASNTLTYIAGTNGSISGTTVQELALGQDGTSVTAVADPGFKFWYWTDGNTNNPRQDLTVTSSLTVTASFNPPPPFYEVPLPYDGTNGLVFNGPEGLVYTGYANEGQTNAINTVPDFSNAGYQGGGVPIPFIPAMVTITNGPGDDTSLIQSAIDTVSSLPIGTNGFRGAVLLTAGDYTVSNTLIVAESGVVIRGEGSQEVGGTLITYTATTKSNLFEVDNKGDKPREVSGSRQIILDEYVPVGVKRFHVENASGFSVGDRIIVENTMNQQWIDDLEMAQYGWTTNNYQLKNRRIITGINGDIIMIDAPIVQPIETQYGGGAIYKYNFTGELNNIGFEGLRLLSTYTSETDELHGWTAIIIQRLRNGWVRQVTGKYFGHGVVNIKQFCQYITVEDCAMLDPKSITTGGRKYLFNINNSEYILMQRCLTWGGRHDFVSGSKTPGPNVFVDCRGDNTKDDIGPHHRYSMGQLYDNVKGGELFVQNRTYWGSGHGWSGAQIMFWNCNAWQIMCDAPVGAMNWCVGSYGYKSEGEQAPWEPFGIWYSHKTFVQPRSLYYAELADRLGVRSLNNVILPEQKINNIWTELNVWGGDGLFMDGLLVWTDEEPISTPSQPVAIRGIVRNLQMMDRGFTSSWSKISGPGTVLFANENSLETTATFSQSGSYELQLTLDDGTVQETATLMVHNGTAASFYNDWMNLYPTLGVHTNLLDDAENDGVGDGVLNLLEYALGGNPVSNDASAILPVSSLATDNGTNWMDYVYTRHMDAAERGLTYTVLSGTNLVNNVMTNKVPTTSISPTTNGYGTATHRISTDTEAQQFMRLEIEYN